jgi:hypothetical protein
MFVMIYMLLQDQSQLVSESTGTLRLAVVALLEIVVPSMPSSDVEVADAPAGQQPWAHG